MAYEFLKEDDIKLILLDQARQVETLMFQHELYKPSKLANNNAAYLEWQNKNTILENQMKSIKKGMMEQGFTVQDLMELIKEKE
tara:strand:- start:456 stop:707 length:252 start_codon:yes stop_codon:yes gene_type:complete